MIAFPFANAFSLKRAAKGNQGEYMALYSISFSIASILGHNAGLQSIAYLGYNNTWFMMTGIAFLCVALFYFLKLYIKRNSINPNRV